MILWQQIARTLETQARQNSENPMPKLKRKYPLIRREPVTQLPCDIAFDRAMGVHKKTIDNLRTTSSVCLFTTGKILRSALHNFDLSEPALDALQRGLSQGLAEQDFILIGRIVREFMSGIDRTKINFGDESSAEAAIVSAIDHYSNALEHWAMADYDQSHSYTVMARSSLTKLGD